MGDDRAEARGELAEARAEAGGLRAAVGELAAKLDVAQQQNRLLRRLTLWVAALLLLAVAGGTTTGVLLYQQASRTNSFLAEGRASRAAIFRINDCIDPAGTCARRSATTTATLVGQIVDANHNGRADTQEILDALAALERTR
jgi:hypothetical protein